MTLSVPSLLNEYRDIELQAHVSLDDVLLKVSEESHELSQALWANDPMETQKEATDVMINVLSVASRFVDIEALPEARIDESGGEISDSIALWMRQTASIRGRYSREKISMETYEITTSHLLSQLRSISDHHDISPLVREASEKFRSRVSAYLPDIDLHDFIATCQDFPKPGILFRDIAPLLNHPEALRYASFELARRCQNADVIAGLDARGFIFGSLVAGILEKPFVMIRKKGKLPGETWDESYDLEYGSNTISLQKNAIVPGQKVAIIDDLLATGGTLRAAANLVERIGAEVESILCLISLDEPFLAEQPARKQLSRYRVESVLHFQ